MKTPQAKRGIFWIAPTFCAISLMIAAGDRATAQTNTFPSNGNAGIGTTTPDPNANLHVYKTTTLARTLVETTSTTGYAEQGFKGSGREYYNGVGGASETTYGVANKYFLFDATVSAIRMVVDSSGNMGIGTTAPAKKLHVFGSNSQVLIDRTANTAGNYALVNFATAGVQKFFFGLNADAGAGVDKLSVFDSVFSASTPVMTFTGGNVGLGTTSPLQKLQIGTNTMTATATPDSISLGATYSSTAGANAKLRLWDDNAGNVYGLGISSQQFDFIVPNVAKYVWNFSGVEKMRLNNNGTLGIGTSNPNSAYKLDVNGTINATGLTVNGSAVTSSQWTTTGTTINYATGNVGIGQSNPTEKLDVSGNIKVSGTINAKYQDMAEWVDSSQDLTTGTVVVLDTSKSNQVIASTRPYDSKVAGVVSFRPGLTLGEEAEGRVLVATTGRVKVKVDASNAPIRVGDLLVTSERGGFAMKSTPLTIGGVEIHRPGTLIGKALEPLEKGTGEILVLLSLQ